MKTRQEAIEIREVFAETGGNISQTAKRCGCCRNTVRAVLKRNYEINDGKTPRPHLHPEDAQIEQILLENLPDARRSRKLRITATRVARIMRAEGCQLSERQLVRRVSVVRKRLKDTMKNDVFLELNAPRGAYQVDFGEFEVYLDDVRTTVHGLIVSSAFSNACAITACNSEDSASLFDGLESCFKQLGGVPPVLRFDNLTPAVIWNKKQRTMTEPFSRFVVHHGFRPEFCNPRSGWEKGNVECKVKYVRNNFFNPVSRCRYKNMANLNEALAQFALADNNRIHYKKKKSIASLLESERIVFGELKSPFGYIEQRPATVDKQGFVQYRGNRYFTTHNSGKKSVIIQATANEVVILDAQFKQLAKHQRCYEKNKRIQPAYELAVMLSRKKSAIPYVIQPINEAKALRKQLRGKRSAECVEPIMQILTKNTDVSSVNSMFSFTCAGYTPNLHKYDTLAGLNG